MSSKTVGTGVLATAGVVGTGYGIYYVSQPHTLGDILVNEWVKGGSGEEGRPFTASDSSWFKKGFDRYDLETKDQNFQNIDKKLPDLGSDSDENRLRSFMQKCIDLLNSSVKDKDFESKKEKAKAWCVTYKTVGDEIGNKKLSEITESNRDLWVTKYTSATSTSIGNATRAKEIYKSLNENDELMKQSKAIYAWCEQALNMSASMREKVDGTYGSCILVDK